MIQDQAEYEHTEFQKQFVKNESFKQLVVTFVEQLLSDDRKSG